MGWIAARCHAGACERDFFFLGKKEYRTTFNPQITHVAYKNFEPDATEFLFHANLLITLPLIPGAVVSHELQGSPFATYGLSFTVFYITLLLSILLYRLSPWHPLARYPGPFIGRVTLLWTAYVIQTGKAHIYRKHLHDTYGPYVRVGELSSYLSGKKFLESNSSGPNEISVCDASILNSVLGSEGMPKGPGAFIPFVH